MMLGSATRADMSVHAGILGPRKNPSGLRSNSLDKSKTAGKETGRSVLQQRMFKSELCRASRGPVITFKLTTSGTYPSIGARRLRREADPE